MKRPGLSPAALQKWLERLEARILDLEQEVTQLEQINQERENELFSLDCHYSRRLRGIENELSHP